MSQDPYPGLGEVKDLPTRTALRFVWDRIAVIVGNTFGPRSGTILPDQRPALGANDTGTIFAATDYNRRYRWTGSAWEDDSQAPARFQIAYFQAGRSPGTGWVRCDGAGANASTSTGTTEYITTPTIPMLNGQPAWIRL